MKLNNSFGKHVFWDHLPFWVIMAGTVGFMIFDVYSQMNGINMYAPKPTI